jgi:uncharacterized protein YaeQ
MAQGTTIYTFEIQLSDPARELYQTLSFSVAQHPSETHEYLLTRILAYCFEYTPGIEFTKGLADSEAPALWVHDLTGRMTAWIEVGAPSAERLHRASKKVGRVAIYTYKNRNAVLDQLKGERIHQAHKILLHSIPQAFLKQFEALLQRRNQLELSLSERQVYLNVAGQTLLTEITTSDLETFTKSA